MLLDPHEHNLALYLAAAGERARADGAALPDGGFADTLRTRLMVQAAEPLPRQPREPRRPRVAWTLPAFLHLPRLPPLLPVALVSVLLLAGVVAAHEVIVVFESLPLPGSPSAIIAAASNEAAPSDSVAASADSLATASGEPSSQPTPEGTAPAGSGPTPRPTPKSSGAPTPSPSGAPTSPPTPGPTAPATPVPTAVPTAVPTPTPTPTPAPTVPDAPFLVSAVGGLSSGEVVLDWLPPLDDGGDGITGYNVCQSDQQGGPYPCSATGSTVTVTTVSGLIPGNQYWFRVEAVNSVGAGPMSNEDTAFATP